MNLQIDPVWLTGFLLAMVRAIGWVLVCPPFSSPVVNSRVKVALAVSLAVVMAGSFHGDAVVLGSTWSFVAALVGQALVGLALGFAVLVLFSAVQSAGQLIDLGAGFSGATLFDPFSNATSSPIGRLYQVLGVAILFAINGHLLLVQGFMASFRLAPLSGLSLSNAAGGAVHDVSTFFVAAIQIAFPLLAAMLLTEIVLGLVARAAPQMNVLVLGFGVKIGLVLLLTGLAIRVLPGAVTDLLGRSLAAMAHLVGG